MVRNVSFVVEFVFGLVEVVLVVVVIIGVSFDCGFGVGFENFGDGVFGEGSELNCWCKVVSDYVFEEEYVGGVSVIMIFVSDFVMIVFFKEFVEDCFGKIGDLIVLVFLVIVCGLLK